VLNTVGGTRRLTYVPAASTASTSGTDGTGAGAGTTGVAHSAGYGARLARRRYLKSQGITDVQISEIMKNPNLVKSALTQSGSRASNMLYAKAAAASAKFDEIKYLLSKGYSRKDIAWFFNTYSVADGRKKSILYNAATSNQRSLTSEDLAYHSILGYSSGGPVWGKGGTRSDSILARLSNGEFVMKASSVKNYGVDFMNALNSQQVAVSRQGFSGSSSSNAAGSQIVYLSPEDRSLLRSALDRPVNLYTENTKIAQSANAGNVILAQRGVN